MHKLKALSIGGAVLIALLASTTAAHATTVTSPSGTQYSGTISAESTNSVFEGSFTSVPCKKMVITWKVESQGAGVTAEGKVSTFSFLECSATVTVKKTGSVSKHSSLFGNATMTGSGQEFVVHSSVGECIFTTSNTDLGVVKGGFPARVVPDNTRVVPRTGGSFFCGSSMEWKGDFTVTTPRSLFFD